jgi:signal transduction histidine kinase
MRLLQVSLRSLLLYSLVLVILSVPLSLFSIREILNEEVDETLDLHADQFLNHIKQFTYLEDLETDLQVLDQLSYNIHIKPSSGQEIPEHFETISVYDSAENEFRPFRQLSSSVSIKGKPYVLSIQMSLVDNDQLVRAISLVQTVLIILLTAGLLFLNRSLSRKLWKPFYQTLAQLKAYELDKNKSIEPEKTNIIEFDDLNKTVSLLTDRNRKVYLQQKEFIENASHELQTPLAIFQGKLDILMQSPTLSESDAATIMELETTAQRMARLNKNLLLLSKIDNEQFVEKEEVEISILASELLNNLRSVAELDQITIEFNAEETMLMCNKSLMEILLTNLFHNAIRHNRSGGKIIVSLHKEALKISNSGQPMKMSTEKIFERFSKENTSVNSTGLGLAIVKKICDTCRYTLNYVYENDMHHFLVKF